MLQAGIALQPVFDPRSEAGLGPVNKVGWPRQPGLVARSRFPAPIGSTIITGVTARSGCTSLS